MDNLESSQESEYLFDFYDLGGFSLYYLDGRLLTVFQQGQLKFSTTKENDHVIILGI
jgi:hypothetical protein